MSDWIEWHGGECPVPPDTVISVISRGGSDWGRKPHIAGLHRWNHWGVTHDIVAYRIIKESHP